MSETARGTIIVPSLHGGVSRQPPHVRFPNQVQDADNFRFSIEDGASKRPGTEYVCDIDYATGSTFNGDSNPRVHAIERDEDERYVAIYGPNLAGTAFVLNVFDTDGNSASISYASGTQTDVDAYLETGLVGFTNGDYTTATRTVTSTSAFANYTFRKGDRLSVYDWGTTGGSPTTGDFLIESRTSDDAIVLAPQSKQTETLPNANSTGQVDARIGSSDDYRLVTVADTTIIVNTRAAVAMEDSADYDVSGTVKDYRSLLGHTPDNEAYIRTEEDDATEVAGYWQYTPADDLTYAKIRFAAVSGEWARPSGHWNDSDNTASEEQPGGFKISQARTSVSGFTAGSWTASTRTITKASAFASYTHRPGDMIYIVSGTGFDTGWYLVESKTDDSNIVLAVAAKQTNTFSGSDQTDIVANDDPDGGSSGCVFGNEVEVVVDFSGNNAKYDMHDIAYGIQRELRSQGWINGCVSWNPVAGGGYFEITGSYRGSTAKVYKPTSPTGGGSTVNDWTDSGDPFYPNDATTTAGTGTLGATDELSVNPAFRWTRVAAPGQTRATFSPETMPVKLTRTGIGASLAFTLSTIDWSDRLTGDSKTNPAPKPFDESGTTSAYIKDAVYFEGRLCFGVGEYLICSEADNLFNFFLVDSTQVVDSDRISRTVGTNRIANIQYLTPYRRSMLITTEGGQQFQLGFGEALTPSNFALNQTSSYRTSDIRPVVMGPFMYMVADRDDGSAIWEYFHDESSGSYVSNEITKHCSGYVPENLRGIVADSVNEVLACAAPNSRDIYIYRTHLSGNDKALASWSRYRFDSTYDIQDLCVLGGDIYMLVHISGEWMLERLPMVDQDTPSGFDYMPHMDRLRRVDATDLSLDTGNTIIELNGTKASSSTYNAYLLTTAEGGTYVTANDDGQTWTYGTGGLNADQIKVTGDITADDIYLGRYYESTMTLTRPFVRDERGRAGAGQRLNVLTLWISHEDSGKYRVLRTNENASWPDAETEHTPTSVTESGYLRVPCRHDADAETVEIDDAVHNASGAAVATPLNISGLEYEVEAKSGARRN